MLNSTAFLMGNRAGAAAAAAKGAAETAARKWRRVGCVTLRFYFFSIQLAQ